MSVKESGQKEICRLEQIGSGGSSEVYKAYHTRLNTNVAVKISPVCKGNGHGVCEAELLHSLRHPCLPIVYEYYQTDEEDCMVMEYIPGRNIKEEVQASGRLLCQHVMKCASQLAQVLAFLHAQNPPVIHGDIKPSNIMLTPEDTIRLIDFHISQRLWNDRAKAYGISIGYSPPEQYRSIAQYYRVIGSRAAHIRVEGLDEDITGDTEGMQTVSSTGTFSCSGRSDENKMIPLSFEMQTSLGKGGNSHRYMFGIGLDERSDIYSLGASLYYMLTGIRPNRNYDRIEPIDRYGVAMDGEFARIIRRMMDPDPSGRYRNGGELLAAMNAIAATDASSATLDHRFPKI